MALAFLLVLKGIIVWGEPAAAQMMLYDDQLPEGYAYVRFFNATSSDLSLRPVGFADPVKLGASGEDRVSAYYVVEKVANRTLTVHVDPGRIFNFELRPEDFQTVLIEKSDRDIGYKIVVDNLELSQTKARLSFYNVIPPCAAASILLEPKEQAVFKDVAPNAMRGRDVNPAPDPHVSVLCGAEDLASLALGPLDAGGQYSIWLISPEGKPTAFLSKNKIAPYLR